MEALSNRSKERVFVPPAVDDAVLRQANRHLEKLAPTQFTWKSFVPWAAMAACLALAAWFEQRSANRPDHGTFAREDINRDGRVDILDAFALARKIESGERLDQRWDINGDGRIDRADANAIAARAVSLGQLAAANLRRFGKRPSPDRSLEGNRASPMEITFPSFGWTVGGFVEKPRQEKEIESKGSEPLYLGSGSQRTKPRNKENRS